eukprot:snap_masked-scaffold_3-processed-gene-1.5-mRNA-1 protein AED:1.00 eAED:1.00 QI:0/0/0/0/1/1/2/0/70
MDRSQEKLLQAQDQAWVYYTLSQTLLSQKNVFFFDQTNWKAEIFFFLAAKLRVSTEYIAAKHQNLTSKFA